MPKFAQIVMGPAGSGKSTYCAMLEEHFRALKRRCFIVNFDPAAENFKYSVTVDVRELVQLEDVMEDEDLKFGPNGGLIFCMEYVMKNLEWLRDNLEAQDDDYFIFDCPGQIELYTHLPAMKQLTETLQSWDFRVCGVFLVDAQFLGDPSKFVSGVLSSLSCMVNLEIPHISIMSKLDLLPKRSKKQIRKYLDPDMIAIADSEESQSSYHSRKFSNLTRVICELIDDYGMVRFLPLDRSDEDSIDIILQNIDMSLQYGEDLEVQDKDFDQDLPESTE
ncbi:GPN-loop GTPase 3 [Ciona intestinalis]